MSVEEACKELDVFCTSMAVGEEVLGCIPPMEEALRLCEIYFECSKFLYVQVSPISFTFPNFWQMAPAAAGVRLH